MHLHWHRMKPILFCELPFYKQTKNVIYNFSSYLSSLEFSPERESIYTYNKNNISAAQVNSILMLWFCNALSVIYGVSTMTTWTPMMPSGPQMCEANEAVPSVPFCSLKHQMRTFGTYFGNLEHTISSVFAM